MQFNGFVWQEHLNQNNDKLLVFARSRQIFFVTLIVLSVIYHISKVSAILVRSRRSFARFECTVVCTGAALFLTVAASEVWGAILMLRYSLLHRGDARASASLLACSLPVIAQ